MARARNIKPALFKNELLGVVDPLLSLLFVSLWCLADREGRLEDRPLRIQAETFPYRTGIDTDDLLTDLAAMGFIRRYQVDGVALIQIDNFLKHQNPHKHEAPSVLPPPMAVVVPPKAVDVPPLAEPVPSPHGSRPADVLIPDLLIPDVLIPDGKPVQPPAKKSRTAAPKKESVTGPAWDAYALAYERRYGVPPVRNATVNGKLSNLVARLGQDAPAVAAFFLTLDAAYYLRMGHDVGTLLRDAEMLRTQWATGQRMTHAKAVAADRASTTFDSFSQLIEDAHRSA